MESVTGKRPEHLAMSGRRRKHVKREPAMTRPVTPSVSSLTTSSNTLNFTESVTGRGWSESLPWRRPGESEAAVPPEPNRRRLPRSRLCASTLRGKTPGATRGASS